MCKLAAKIPVAPAAEAKFTKSQKTSHAFSGEPALSALALRHKMPKRRWVRKLSQRFSDPWPNPYLKNTFAFLEKLSSIHTADP